MGWFSSISSALGSSSSSEPEKAESMASLREKNGFKNFDSEMERMKNCDPEKKLEKELQKDMVQASHSKKSTTSRQTK